MLIHLQLNLILLVHKILVLLISQRPMLVLISLVPLHLCQCLSNPPTRSLLFPLRLKLLAFNQVTKAKLLTKKMKKDVSKKLNLDNKKWKPNSSQLSLKQCMISTLLRNAQALLLNLRLKKDVVKQKSSNKLMFLSRERTMILLTMRKNESVNVRKRRL